MRLIVTTLLLATLISPSLHASEKVLNLYSSRHYQTDEKLYSNFTRQTGIQLNRIETKADVLLERLKIEGVLSPADVFLTVDAARLGIAEQRGLFAPVRSQVLEARIPAYLRTEYWFAFSTRERALIYRVGAINPDELRTYEDLAHPRFKGKICSRSGSHPYNLSLLSSIIVHNGEKKAEEWARGVVANFARPPKGGDTDQIRAVAAGECAVAIANTYYLARLIHSDRPKDRAVVEKVRVIWPNQQSRGVHINISGGGVLKNAPNREAAVKFLEYLSTDEAQVYFANGNNERPTVPTTIFRNEAHVAMGPFKADTLPISRLVENISKAQEIVDRVGWR